MDNHENVPAVAINAEQGLLGSLITGAISAADLPMFKSDWFEDPVHNSIFAAIETREANGTSVDVASLSSILSDVLQEVGGSNYLKQLAARPAANPILAVKQIRDAWLRRRIIDPDQMPPSEVISAACPTICRCGAPAEIGHLIIEIAGVRIRVAMTSAGPKWPSDVQISPALSAQLDPFARSEWLRIVCAKWSRPAGRRP